MLLQGSAPDPLVTLDADTAAFRYSADYTATIEQPCYSLSEDLDLHSLWRTLPAAQADIAFADVRSPFIRKALPAILHNQWLGPLIARMPHNLKQNIKKLLRS